MMAVAAGLYHFVAWVVDAIREKGKDWQPTVPWNMSLSSWLHGACAGRRDGPRGTPDGPIPPAASNAPPERPPGFRSWPPGDQM